MYERRPIDIAAAVPAQVGGLAASKLIRNTYALLSMTLIFSALMAGLSLVIHVSYAVSLGCSLGALGLLWFALPRTANSAAGIGVVFGITGLLGFGLGPLLGHYLALPDGGQLVMTAMGMTGAIFLTLSGYALVSKRDFSFMRGFLFTGIMVAFLASLVGLGASLFGYPMPMLHLAVSAMFVFLSSGLILYQTGEMVNGGETNYILATITLYISIYNLFTSLLQLLGVLGSDD